MTIEGHHVVRISHRQVVTSSVPTVAVDMSQAVQPQDWISHLDGIEVVVNCAGVLQDSAQESTHHVHAEGVSALFLACERAGVRKVIHFSAIGADREQPSAFSASKIEGDKTLMTRDLDWVILRPSVVLGRPAFGASALFRGLAALPVLPLMPDTGRLQVVQLDDVVATILFFIRRNSPSRLALELPGPEALSVSEIVQRYRCWLGWGRVPEFLVPGPVAGLLYRLGDLAGWLGWRPPMRTNAAREIRRGATGDPAPWMALTSITPKDLDFAFAAAPATVQERWFAGLYFAKPAVFIVLPFFWIMTGVVSLTTGWQNGVELLVGTAAEGLAKPAVFAGAIVDASIGMSIAWRRTSRIGLWSGIAVSLFYAAAGTILRPDLWNEPLGPFLKILPILTLHFVALAILEER